MSELRVAICQLRSHPALYIGHINYPEEPFVPDKNDPCLSRLGAKGIPVESLHEYCLTEYSTWRTIQLSSILQHLENLNPSPDIVIFPECSIPISCLPTVADWSKKTGAVMLAGTHTPLKSPDARSAYAKIGLGRGQVDRIAHRSKGSILPLITGGKVKVLRKKSFSPFEFSILEDNKGKRQQVRAYSIAAGNEQINIVPLICSEALQQPKLPSEFNIAAVLSYDRNPVQFRSFIDDTVRNRSIVLYCNDGRYGGSSIFVPDDHRVSNWFNDALGSGLPAGDGILVADIDLDVSTIEVGTARPRTALKLVKLESIVYDSPEELQYVETVEDIRRIDNSDARALELANLLRSENMVELQRIKLEQLKNVEARGRDSEEWWEALGGECVCTGIIGLDRLESKMATTCRNELVVGGLALAANRPKAAQDLIAFLAKCQDKADSSIPSEKIVRNRQETIFDRDTEARGIWEFLDGEPHSYLEVTGLPQVGKSSAIRHSLRQHGGAKELEISLNETSSIDYIAYSILRGLSSPPKPPYQDVLSVVKGPQAVRALNVIDTLWIRNTDYLLHHGLWRDKRTPNFLIALIEQASNCAVKVIFEGQRTLPIELEDPTGKARMRITGLPDDYAVSYLNARLRIVGVPTDVLTQRDKRALVKKLGGHPVAITIAADAIYEEGAKNVLDNIRKRRGFYLNFLQSLVVKLQLTDEENEILRLACLARAVIPREAIVSAVKFNPTIHIRNLLNLGALEFGNRGLVQISSLLREYFNPNTLPPEQQEEFHLSTAKALLDYAERFDDLGLEIEAKFHAGFTDWNFESDNRLIDGTLATARRLFDQKRYEPARHLLDQLIDGSDSLDVIRLAALTYAKLNDFDKAIGFARKVFSMNRRDTWLLSELARTALTQSRVDVSRKLIETAKQAGVENVSILLVEGRMLLRQRKLDHALDVFSRARQLTQRNPWPFFYLGRTNMEMGRLEDAVDVLFEGEQFFYDNYIRSKNALRAIRTQLGVCYLYMDRADLAEPIIESLFSDNPNSPEVIRAYAALTIKRDGIEEAHKALEQLRKAKIRNRHDRCQFHLFYGLFCLGINDRDGAEQEFRKAHEADPTNVFVMINQAQTLFDLAIEQWMEGISTYEDYVSDCKNLVKQILRFDVENDRGLEIMHELHKRFGVEFD